MEKTRADLLDMMRNGIAATEGHLVHGDLARATWYLNLVVLNVEKLKALIEVERQADLARE